MCALPSNNLVDAEARFIEIGDRLSERCPEAAISVGFTDLRAGDVLQDAINRADHDLYARRKEMAIASTHP